MDFFDQYFIYIIGGVVCLIGLIFFVVFQFEKKRANALREAAAGMGFLFTEKFLPDNEYKAFKLFNQGRAPKASNLINGSYSGFNLKIFDYKFTVGGGNSQHSVRQTVVSTELKNTRLPHFFLGPENVFHKIGQKFGYQDIDFEHFPEFSKHYLLRGEDESQIRQLFKPYILEFLQRKHMKHTLEGNGRKMIYYRENKRIKPVELKDFIQDFLQILTLFDR